MKDFLQQHFEWTHKTFGTGLRTKGITNHIRKELSEIESDPHDLEEWIDVLLLAFDGAGRTGASPERIIEALRGKSEICKKRHYPFPKDEHTESEHIRSTIELIIKEISELVKIKGQEYVGNSTSRYRNFEQGALLQNETPQQTLLGYANKQVVSLFDCKTLNTERLNDIDFINEKAGDTALYMILLIAMVRDYNGKQ